MPLLGLIDWIVLSIIALAVCSAIVCFVLMSLFDLFQFKPESSFRPATYFKDSTGETRRVDAPRFYYKNYFKREEKLKWYHRIIVGP